MTASLTPSEQPSSDFWNSLSLLSPQARTLLLAKVRERREFIETGNKLTAYYPEADTVWRDQTFHSRHKYPKHLEFFAAGKDHRERCARCANRVGKTEGMGGYEMALHLTGRYPDWWEGRRFDHAINAWAAGKTHDQTRDIIQAKLLGPKENLGTGLIPRETIVGKPPSKPGVPDAFELVNVRHVSGGTSLLGLKSYAEKRDGFEGTEQHVIWLDEEPPMDIYGECLVRTMTTDGIVMLTFTPLDGFSQVVLSFMEDGKP